MPDSRVLFAAAVAGIIAGSALTSWLHSPGPEHRNDPALSEARDADPADSAAGEIAALRASLETERARRIALESELEALRSTPLQQPSPADTQQPDAPKFPARLEALGGLAAEPSAGSRGQKDWFDRNALVESGIDERRAAWLNERFDDLQMNELYVRDEALRDGWQGSLRHRERLWGLRAEVLEALGEEDYDLMLYAAGRKNRVTLNHVLAASPAAVAGIQAGDVLVRYHDQPIFTTHDLVRATSRADLDADVAVHVLRDGETLRLYLPPGPMGVRLEPSRMFPSETR